MSQLSLLKRRSFWPFFWVSFLTAFNDNLVKNSLVFLVTFRSVTVFGLPPAVLVPLSTGIIILPFVLFSGLAGQLLDRYPKVAGIRAVKVAEIGIMLVASFGLMTENAAVLLIMVFLAGTHSAFFGPAKYAYLPEVLEPDELVGANGFVELGTFLAVLGGTISAGLIAALGETGKPVAALLLLTLAVAGAILAFLVPYTAPANPTLKVSWSPLAPSIEMFRAVTRRWDVLVAVLALSWFWLFGSAVLSLVPTYGKESLGGDVSVVTLFNALFCVGIGAGSLSCERLGRGKLELGLVPLGALGLSWFALDLTLAGSGYWPNGVDWRGLLGSFSGLRIALDLTLLSFAGGVFTVPLYTLLQQRVPEGERARVVAGNNLINSVFMVASAGALTGMVTAGVSTTSSFAILGIANLVACALLFVLVPEFPRRFVAWARGGAPRPLG